MKYVLSMCVSLMLMVFVLSYETKAEEWPPRNNGFMLPLIFGPEGIGGGVGYAAYDFGKEGRSAYIYPIIADTDYRSYLFGYHEPKIIKEGDHIDLTAFYQKRTGTHFFGIGSDREMEDGAYYQRENYLYKLSYTIPVTDIFFGLSGSRIRPCGPP